MGYMDYEDFKTELMYELGLRSGEEYTFKLNKANLRNQSEVDAILVVYNDDAGICPQLYVKDFYERYVEYGTDVVDIAYDLLALADKHKAEVDAVKLAMSTVNAENAKERLIMHVQNRDWNKAMLDDIVYMDLGADLIGVAKYELPELDAFITVTKGMQGHLCLTEDEIIEMAYQNSINQEFKVQGLFDVVKDLFEDGIGMTEEQNPMFIMSNKSGHFGANVLMSKKMLKEMEELFHEKYFVLPSSIHEVIAIPESRIDDVQFLKEMVVDVNSTQVDVRERLSDNVYRVSNGRIAISNTQEQLETLRKEEMASLQKEINKSARRRSA